MAAPEARRSTRLGRLLEREHVLAGVLLAPTLAILAVFIAYPFLLGIWLAVSDKVVGRPGHFIGLENFRVNLADSIYLRAFQNTFVYTFLATILKLFIGMLAALLLNHHFKFKRIVRASYVLTRGGPYSSTHVFGTYAYEIAMRAAKLGQGASISLSLFPFLLAVIMFQLWYIRRSD